MMKNEKVNALKNASEELAMYKFTLNGDDIIYVCVAEDEEQAKRYLASFIYWDCVAYNSTQEDIIKDLEENYICRYVDEFDSKKDEFCKGACWSSEDSTFTGGNNRFIEWILNHEQLPEEED